MKVVFIFPYRIRRFRWDCAATHFCNDVVKMYFGLFFSGSVNDFLIISSRKISVANVE